eukprot:2972813-Amphidinium_carterae.1
MASGSSSDVQAACAFYGRLKGPAACNYLQLNIPARNDWNAGQARQQSLCFEDTRHHKICDCPSMRAMAWVSEVIV